MWAGAMSLPRRAGASVVAKKDSCQMSISVLHLGHVKGAPLYSSLPFACCTARSPGTAIRDLAFVKVQALSEQF